MTKYKLIIDDFGGWALFQKLLATLQQIGQKHGTSISTVASAYILQKPQVAAVIVGARNASHLKDNTSIASLKLDAEDLSLIESALVDAKKLPGDVYELERNDPRHSGIMQTGNNRVSP